MDQTDRGVPSKSQCECDEDGDGSHEDGGVATVMR